MSSTISSKPYQLPSQPPHRYEPPPIALKEQIRKSYDLRPNTPRVVLQLSDSTIFKVGTTVKVAEAEALRLVARKASNVPVPAVLHVYRDEKSGMGYIIMTKLEGEPLSHQWAHMSLEKRKDITSQLAYYVREWRKIRGSFLGAVDGGPCPDTIFRHPHSIAAHPDASYGPYESRHDFIQGVVEALRNSRPAGHRDALDDQTESRILASKAEDDHHGIVLTHGDLNKSNILVKDGVVTGIVDWGGAGYSIEEREYLEAKIRGTDLSWEEAVDAFVPAFPDKFTFWEHVISEMMAYSGI